MLETKEIRHWPNQCHHKKREYICSFKNDKNKWIDLYCYLDGDIQEIHFCMRFGHNGWDYISAGNIENVRRAAYYLPDYKLALQILTEKGII